MQTEWCAYVCPFFAILRRERDRPYLRWHVELDEDWGSRCYRRAVGRLFVRWPDWNWP
jgi:hypothetical protein